MKKWYSLLVYLSIYVLVIAGCGGNSNPVDQNANENDQEVKKKIASPDEGSWELLWENVGGYAGEAK